MNSFPFWQIAESCLVTTIVAASMAERGVATITNIFPSIIHWGSQNINLSCIGIRFRILRNCKQDTLLFRDKLSYDIHLYGSINFSRRKYTEFSDLLDKYSFWPRNIQCDTERWPKPPVDFKAKVPFWLGLGNTGQAKAELLFRSQREVYANVLCQCHPLDILWPNFSLGVLSIRLFYIRFLLYLP